MRIRASRRVAAAGLAVAALGLGGVAMADPFLNIRIGSQGQHVAHVTVTVTGELFLDSTNSRNGRPVIVAEGLLPGETRSGEVTVTAKGLLRSRFRLDASGLTDVQGPGGGTLSQRLRLKIQDLAYGRTVYDGTLGALRTVRFPDVFKDGEARRFRFTATFPPAADDNALMGSSSKVTLTWTGEDCTVELC